MNYMKNTLVALLTFFCIAASQISLAQTVLIIPNDQWFIRNGFYKEVNVGGNKQRYPEYKKALQEGEGVVEITSEVTQLFKQRFYTATDLAILNFKDVLDQNNDFGMMANEIAQTVPEYSSTLKESPLDMLSRTASSDLIIDLLWEIKETGPSRYMQVTMSVLDSYTKEVIGTYTDRSRESRIDPKIDLMKDAVNKVMPLVATQIQNFAADLAATDARKVPLNIVVTQDAGYKLNSDCNENGTFREGIAYWVSEESVNNSFANPVGSGINELRYPFVRMPRQVRKRNFVGELDDTPVGPNDYARSLADFLSEFCGCEATPYAKGQESWVILGARNP